MRKKLSKRARKEKADVKDCLPERKYGKPHHPFAKRFGCRAYIMRKQYRVNIPVTSQHNVGSLPWAQERR